MGTQTQRKLWLAPHDENSYAIGYGDIEVAIFPTNQRDSAAFIVLACNAHESLVRVLGKILRASDSGNNGAYMGEAKLCRAFEREAMEALVAAGAESELMGGSLEAHAALAKVTP